MRVYLVHPSWCYPETLRADRWHSIRSAVPRWRYCINGIALFQAAERLRSAVCLAQETRRSGRSNEALKNRCYSDACRATHPYVPRTSDFYAIYAKVRSTDLSASRFGACVDALVCPHPPPACQPFLFSSTGTSSAVLCTLLVLLLQESDEPSRPHFIALTLPVPASLP